MSCESYQSQIGLYLYDELGAVDTEALEAHIESCSACSRALAEEREFFAAMQELPPAEPSHALVAECRHDLMREVYRTAPEPATAWTRFTRWFSGESENQFAWRPALVVASLALAFVVGRTTSSDYSGLFTDVEELSLQGPMTSFPSEPLVSGIESIALDPRRNQVEIVVEEVSRRRFAGHPHDPQIHDLLLSTARNSPNSSARLDSLDILTGRVDEIDVRRTLLHSMVRDRNPGVRLKALEALRRQKDDPEVRRALIDVLRRDPNSGMRVYAIDLLTEQPDRKLVGVLQELVETEGHEYIRLRSRRVLQDLNASVDRF